MSALLCHAPSIEDLALVLEHEIRRARERNLAHARVLEDIQADPRMIHQPEIFDELKRAAGLDHARAVLYLAGRTLAQAGEVYVHAYLPEGDECERCGTTGVLKLDDGDEVRCPECVKGYLEHWSCLLCTRSNDVDKEAGGYLLFVHSITRGPTSWGAVCQACVAKAQRGDE